MQDATPPTPGVLPTQGFREAGDNGNYAGNAYFPGRGHMSAVVEWSENSTESRPIKLVSGVDVDGRAFRVEVSVYDIDLNRASIIDLFALRGYLRDWTATSELGLLIGTKSNVENSFVGFANVAAHLSDRLEDHRFHGNFDLFTKLRELLEKLMELFPNHFEGLDALEMFSGR
jgi:hypothetical protein